MLVDFKVMALELSELPSVIRIKLGNLFPAFWRLLQAQKYQASLKAWYSRSRESYDGRSVLSSIAELRELRVERK